MRSLLSASDPFLTRPTNAHLWRKLVLQFICKRGPEDQTKQFFAYQTRQFSHRQSKTAQRDGTERGDLGQKLETPCRFVPTDSTLCISIDPPVNRELGNAELLAIYSSSTAAEAVTTRLSRLHVSHPSCDDRRCCLFLIGQGFEEF